MEVAIITGAGSGIGLATAKALYGMGMAIVGVGRDPGQARDAGKRNRRSRTPGHPVDRHHRRMPPHRPSSGWPSNVSGGSIF